MAKGKSLKTLKVRVNKDGTLSKKSLEDIQKVDKPSVGEKIASRIDVQDGINLGTFVGLTVAVKYGMVDPLSFIMGIDWHPGKLLEETVDVLKDAFKQLVDSKYTKREKELIRERFFWLDWLRSKEVSEAGRENMERRVRDIDAELVGIPPEGSELRAAEADALYENKREAIHWLASMGIAGWAIKFAESHTVSDVVELIPGQ